MYKLLIFVLPIVLFAASSFLFPQYFLAWKTYNNYHFRNSPTPTPTVVPTPKPTPIPTPKPTAVPTSVPGSGLSFAGRQSWGAYVGWSPQDGTDFEAKVGKPMKNRATFVHWGNENEFPDYLAPTLKQNNETLTIFWEAMDYNGPVTDQPDFSYSSILSGRWDSYIKSFAGQVKAYGGPVILIPFEEANGDWYPWSINKNGNTMAQYVQAYRYLRGFFADVPNVKFAWDMNCVSEPDIASNRIDLYYPGDAYVDVVGLNGFNMNNPWQTFDQIFGAPLATMAQYKKPIYIFSMASAQGTQKASWITDALTVQISKHPEIAGWVWFNENKEQNWLVWSDPQSLDAFKTAISRYP